MVVWGVPTAIHIQYTINGKKVEVAIKRIISGEHVVASGTLANPAVLDLYRNLPALQVATAPPSSTPATPL